MLSTFEHPFFLPLQQLERERERGGCTNEQRRDTHGALDRKHMCCFVPWEQLHPSLSPFSHSLNHLYYSLSSTVRYILRENLSERCSLSSAFNSYFSVSVFLVIHTLEDHLIPFPPFPSFLAVRAFARDSTHAFNLGGREPRSAASLQLRNFPPSLQSAHTLIERRETEVWGHQWSGPSPFCWDV